jgi:ribose-phosphate pyrophosphokinase
MSVKHAPPVLISADAHPQLAAGIAAELRLSLSPAEVATFADGETHVHITADVRNAVVVIVQPTSPPVNDHLVSLALLADAAIAAGAGRIVAVVPYFGYSRQEQRSAVGDARSARLAASFLGMSGIDHLVTLDLHAPALESAFPMPATLLQADELFLPVIEEWGIAGLTIVAPDGGAMKRAQRFAGRLDAGLAVVAKTRTGPDSAAVLGVLGDVRGRECVIVDDMASTGRTLAGAAEALRAAGAAAAHAVFTHPVMAERAIERLLSAPLERLVTSDSIPSPEHPRIQTVSVASLLADAIRKVLGGEFPGG